MGTIHSRTYIQQWGFPSHVCDSDHDHRHNSDSKDLNPIKGLNPG